MLKFKGKSWEIQGYLQHLISEYGAKATLKEVIRKAVK